MSPPLVMSEGDLGAELEDFDRRLHQLEQFVTGTTIMGPDTNTNFPDGITVGGINVDAGHPGQATGVVPTAGAYYDDIFIDVNFVEAVGGTDAVSFDVELATWTPTGPFGAHVYTTVTFQNTGGTHVRFSGLQPMTNYAVRVWPVSNLGVRPLVSPTWVEIATTKDSTVPVAPALVIMGRGAGSVIVYFTPLSAVTYPDVATGHGIYEIQIDTVDLNTTAPTANIRAKYDNAQVTAFADIPLETTWYGRVRAIDSSGNVGPWSATANTLGGGTQGYTVLPGIYAPNITTGFLSATIIGDNTVPVTKITTSTLVATTITLGTNGKIQIASGGQIFINNPTTNGILINSSGITAYQSGSQTFSIDATGNVVIKGSITAGSSINASDIYGGTINGTVLNGAVLNINSPPTEGIKIDGTGITAYAKPNWIYQDDVSAEYSIGNWVGYFNVTVSRSTVFVTSGVPTCLRMRATASGQMSMYLIDYNIPGGAGLFGGVTAGQVWTGRIRTRAGSVPRSCQMEIRYYSAAGALLQTNAGTAVTNSTSDFTEISATGVAPAGVWKVGILLYVNGPGANENHYFYNARLTLASDPSYKPISIGAGGDIQIIGKSITAQSFRTDSSYGDHPGTTISDGSGQAIYSGKASFYADSSFAYNQPAQIYGQAAAAYSVGGGGFGGGPPYSKLVLAAPRVGTSSGTAGLGNIDLSGFVQIVAGARGTTALLMKNNGDIDMGIGRLKGSFDGSAPDLSGYEGHAHTFGWSSYGAGNMLSFYIDTSTTFEIGFNGSSMDFFYGGGFVKSFVINNPIDEEKLLVHACLEGPAADVYYRGEGVTHFGESIVWLPDYFEALTREKNRSVFVFHAADDEGFTSMAEKLSWSQVKEGRFTVRSKSQRARFSWLVMATRKDVPELEVTPLKSSVTVKGSGPYTYI